MKPIILLILGALIFFLGAFFVAINYVDNSWPRVPGTVIGVRDASGIKAPVVEYTAGITKFQVIPSDQPVVGSFQPGKKLVVAYNPNSQGEAKIADSGLLAVLPWALIVTGAVLVVAGNILRKRSHEESSEDIITTPDLSDSSDTYIHQV